MRLYESLVKNVGIGKDVYVKEWLKKNSQFVQNVDVEVENGKIVGDPKWSQLWLATDDIPDEIEIEKLRDLIFDCDVKKAPKIPVCHTIQFNKKVERIKIILDKCLKQPWDDYSTSVVFRSDCTFKNVIIQFKAYDGNIAFYAGDVEDIASVKCNCIHAQVSSRKLFDKYDEILFQHPESVGSIVGRCFPKNNYQNLKGVQFQGMEFKKDNDGEWIKV